MNYSAIVNFKNDLSPEWTTMTRLSNILSANAVLEDVEVKSLLKIYCRWSKSHSVVLKNFNFSTFS